MTRLADTVKSFGPAQAAALDLLHTAARFRDVTGPDDDPQLAAYDAVADEFIAGAAALLCFAPGQARHVASAFQLATESLAEDRWSRDARRDAALARVVYGTVLSVLHLEGPTALVPLSHLDLNSELLLGTNAFRFARHHGGNAKVTYQAVSEWIAGPRAWLQDLPGLDAQRVSAALAEVDLLLACIAVRRFRQSDVYSAGGAVEPSAAPARLRARLRDRDQRAALATLLDTTDDKLDEDIATADQAITSQSEQGFPLRRPPIVQQAG